MQEPAHTIHPFFYGTSVKSSYIYTDDKTTTFNDLISRNQTHEIAFPSYDEYHVLERKKQQEIKANSLKFILPVSMVSLQRRSEFANRIELIILDIDNGKGISLPEIHEKLAEKNLNHWLYTTISHTEKSPKYRVIVEANGLMTPDLYNQCIVAVTHILGLTIGPPSSNSNVDSTSRDVVHAMFLPAKFRSNPQHFEEIKFAEGRPFNPSDINWEAVENIIERVSARKIDGTASIGYSQPPMEGLSKDTVNSILNQIRHMAIDYDEWLKVGMAIHHQYRGNEEGFQTWDYWSRTNGEDKYDKIGVQKAWESFNGHRPVNQRAITFRSCFSWAMQEDWKPVVSRDDLTPLFIDIQDLREDQKTPEEIRIGIDNIADRIRYTPMLPEHREELIMEAMAIIKKFQLPFTKGHISKKFAFANVLSLSRVQAPSWCKQHAYITSGNEILVSEKGIFLKEDAYNNTYNSVIRDSMTYDPEMNTKSTRVKPSPWERALDWYHIPKVDDFRFDPSKPSMFREGESSYYNTFKRKVIACKPRENWTVEDKNYVDFLINHLSWMFEPHHIKTFLSYIAVTAFQPATKIRWAIFMHSDSQGIGKSLFFHIARLLMGENMISTVKSRQISDLSSKWKENKKLVIVEEAALDAKEMEYLKDDISNDRLIVRTMYRDSVELPNYVNFIFISNTLDGIKLKSSKDRRFYVASSKVHDRGDLYKYLRTFKEVTEQDVLDEMERNKEFGRSDDMISEEKQLTVAASTRVIFKPLFNGLETHKDAVCGWMREVYEKNRESFDPSSPKLTDEFHDLVDLSEDPLAISLRDIIDEEAELNYVNNDFVVTQNLHSILFNENPLYLSYRLPDWYIRKTGIGTVQSIRTVLMRELKYKDVGTFIMSDKGEKKRIRVLTKNISVFRNMNESERNKYVLDRIRHRKSARIPL